MLLLGRKTEATTTLRTVLPASAQEPAGGLKKVPGPGALIAFEQRESPVALCEAAAVDYLLQPLHVCSATSVFALPAPLVESFVPHFSH